MTIAVYDTFCGSLNSGDGVIMDAVHGVLEQLFPLQHKISYPTHYPLSLKAVRKVSKSEIAFVGGTNLLSSAVRFWPSRNQWAVGYIESLILRKKIILLGCGWKNYESSPNFGTRLFYKKILSDDYIHSIRDSYSERMLRGMGISNVLNTGCPTMWELNESHCLQVPREKGMDVAFTLTDYRRSPADDFAMIQLLKSSYRNLYFWAQGSRDLEYLSSLMKSQPFKSVQIIGPALTSFDSILRNTESIDYVGTRLHAGVRALQMKKRTIIVGIDNRALEKKRDFNLSVIERGNLDSLKSLVLGSLETKIRIPIDKISAWKSQFSGSSWTSHPAVSGGDFSKQPIPS